MSTSERDTQGRFIVSLPFVKNTVALGDSRISAHWSDLSN